MKPTPRFLVFRSHAAKHYLCICAARDNRHALAIARRMFRLERSAYAVRIDQEVPT